MEVEGLGLTTRLDSILMVFFERYALALWICEIKKTKPRLLFKGIWDVGRWR